MHAAEFRDPSDERIGKHAARFQILEQCGAGLVEDWAVDIVL